jgi:hypothetical protein
MPPFDYTPPPYDGPRAEEISRKRAEFLSPSLFHFYDRPVRYATIFSPLPFLWNDLGGKHCSITDRILDCLYLKLERNTAILSL